MNSPLPSGYRQEDITMTIAVILVETPDDPALGGPRILGRTAKPALIEAVRAELAAERHRELARLQAPVRLVEEAGEGGEQLDEAE